MKILSIISLKNISLNMKGKTFEEKISRKSEVVRFQDDVSVS